MEVRRGTLREFLRTHLQPDRVTHIMDAVEPFIQMVQCDNTFVSLKYLHGYNDKRDTMSGTEVRQDLFFALMHSFMKNLCELMQTKDPNVTNDEIKRFYGVMMEWILTEFVPTDEPWKTYLYELVTNTIKSPHT
jgi:hypothetical protein